MPGGGSCVSSHVSALADGKRPPAAAALPPTPPRSARQDPSATWNDPPASIPGRTLGAMGKKVGLGLVGLGLGAAVGMFATGLVRAQVPQAGSAAMRWEQDCDQVQGVDGARALAKVRGETGWELVALDAGIMCFKRPIPA